MAETRPAESLLASVKRVWATHNDRRARAQEYGVSAWDQIGFEGAARVAYQELVRRDKRLLVGDFDNTPEPLVMVFARGSRVGDVKRLLASLHEDEQA